MLLRIFIFFTLTQFTIAGTSQEKYVIYDDALTAATIKRLSTGPQVIKELHFDENDSLVAIHYTQEYPLVFERHFYPGGGIYKEGLILNYLPVGKWNYYTEKGLHYKTADYNTFTRTLHGMAFEPFDDYFSDCIRQSEQIIIDRIGKDVFDQYVSISRYSDWHVENDGAVHYHPHAWFDTPPDTAKIQAAPTFNFCFDDTTCFSIMLFFDSAGNRIESDLLPFKLPDCKHFPEKCRFETDHLEASALAASLGFPATVEIGIDSGSFTWYSLKILDDTPGNETLQLLIIDPYNGTVDSSETWKNHTSHSGGKYPYTTPYIPQPLKTGHKLESTRYMYVTLPNKWMHIKEYYYDHDDLTYFENGGERIYYYYDAHSMFDEVTHDHPEIDRLTIRAVEELVYFRYVIPENATPEQIERISFMNDSLERLQLEEELQRMKREKEIQDSLAIVYELEEKRLAALEAKRIAIVESYYSSIDSGHVQTRPANFEVTMNDDGTANLRLSILDQSAMWMTPSVSMIFFIDHVSEARLPEVMQILTSLRFKYTL